MKFGRVDTEINSDILMIRNSSYLFECGRKRLSTSNVKRMSHFYGRTAIMGMIESSSGKFLIFGATGS